MLVGTVAATMAGAVAVLAGSAPERQFEP
jgi:hypothetical protein